MHSVPADVRSVCGAVRPPCRPWPGRASADREPVAATACRSSGGRQDSMSSVKSIISSRRMGSSGARLYLQRRLRLLQLVRNSLLLGGALCVGLQTQRKLSHNLEHLEAAKTSRKSEMSKMMMMIYYTRTDATDGDVRIPGPHSRLATSVGAAALAFARR